ncbi:hypothetical protein B0H13DRAFT_1929438 [Mycena leptocephala]|nr:hypothetical protein B0H13DRAFT_1929438 [Mycena leptocephala]
MENANVATPFQSKGPLYRARNKKLSEASGTWPGSDGVSGPCMVRRYTNHVRRGILAACMPSFSYWPAVILIISGCYAGIGRIRKMVELRVQVHVPVGWGGMRVAGVGCKWPGAIRRALSQRFEWRVYLLSGSEKEGRIGIPDMLADKSKQDDINR